MLQPVFAFHGQDVCKTNTCDDQLVGQCPMLGRYPFLPLAGQCPMLGHYPLLPLSTPRPLRGRFSNGRFRISCFSRLPTGLKTQEDHRNSGIQKCMEKHCNEIIRPQRSNSKLTTKTDIGRAYDDFRCSVFSRRNDSHLPRRSLL